MEALAELQGDMGELKEKRCMGPGSIANVRENVNRCPTEVIGYRSCPGFSGFQSFFFSLFFLYYFCLYPLPMALVGLMEALDDRFLLVSSAG